MLPPPRAVMGFARDTVLAAWLLALAVAVAHQAVALADLLGHPPVKRRIIRQPGPPSPSSR